MTYLAKDLENVLKNRVVSGTGEGEKIVLSINYPHLIFLCNNFVSAGKIKRGLEAFGKKVEIVSSARETDDENDKNLLPFVDAINRYISGEVDGLIFLPCSMIIKFDLSKFKVLKIEKDKTYNLQELLETLVNLGYERTSLVSQPGEFALRGDILDIFTSSNDKPYRVEFFDEIVENISIFDENTMKNLEKVDWANIALSKLPLGENNVFDLDGEKVLDQPKKLDEEITLLKQSYATMSFYNYRHYEEFERLYEKADLIFDDYDVIKPDYYNERVAKRS